MEQVFETYGQTILAAISAGAILGLAYFFLFGADGNGGELAQFMFKALESAF